MRFVHEPAPAAGEPGANPVWVMLPGAYMKPDDFLAAGFVEALRTRGLCHDVALLEANIAEVADGSALVLLREYLRTVRQGGMPGRPVRLLGISLGAHLAMACLATAAPESKALVNDAVLLAPYLGPRDIVAEVAAGAALAPGDIDRDIWQWLRSRPADGCPLYLGYGSDDRFARAHALMAQTLPPGQVDVQPGGHAWPVWTSLWQRHLDRFHVH